MVECVPVYMNFVKKLLDILVKEHTCETKNHQIKKMSTGWKDLKRKSYCDKL